jgi:hypothetical protein
MTIIIDTFIFFFILLVLRQKMFGSSEEEQKKLKSGTEDSEDESEILEESPCGRWLKRREVVTLKISNLLKIIC